MSSSNLALFQGPKIRKIWHSEEWWFSVIDVIAFLTDSERPRKYWGDLKRRLTDEGFSELSEKIGQLKLEATDGKMRSTDCANTETLLRIIQTIPSKKVEPLKRWLATVGQERIAEIADPELAQQRMKEIYEKKGYSKAWIDKRIRGISVRQDLTDEWGQRGVSGNRDYAILTNEIMQGTFGMTVGAYKDYKNLNNHNLRDHMTDLELILTMLGEATTTTLTRTRDSKGLSSLQRDAKDGGNVAGRTKADIESKTGSNVSSSQNYLRKPEKDHRKEPLNS